MAIDLEREFAHLHDPKWLHPYAAINLSSVRKFLADTSTISREKRTDDEYVEKIRYSLSTGESLEIRPTGLFTTSGYGYETTRQLTYEAVVKNGEGLVTGEASLFIPVDKAGHMLAEERGNISPYSPVLIGHQPQAPVMPNRFVQAGYVMGAIQRAQVEGATPISVMHPVQRGPRF